MRGFFSTPFGFGALGPKEGRTMLIGLYQAWRKIIGPGFAAGPESLDLFEHEIEANKWRSATFQSVVMAVRGHQQPSDGAAAVFFRNRDRVEGEIHAILDEVCVNEVSREVRQSVARIVQAAGELALEFGSQRARVGLTGPKRGDYVVIGQGVLDCEDGDSARGAVEEVDLVVTPTLLRVGDGRRDLTTEKVIVPGEIYPRRQ